MGLLSTAMKNVMEQTLWLIMVMYILSRGSSIDLQVVNLLDETAIQSYMNILINSPNCLAYQKYDFSVDYIRDQKKVIPKLIQQTDAGVVELTKFFDDAHVSCITMAQFWEGVQTFSSDTSASNQAVGYFKEVENSGLYFDTSTIYNEPDQNRREALKNRGIKRFLDYNVVMKDLVTGITYITISQESKTKVLFTPLRVDHNLPDANWATNSYLFFLNCYSGVNTQSTKSLSKPVVIHFPDGTEHIGSLTLSMCLGFFE